MDYRGYVDNGMIRPEQPLHLPNGTQVEFQQVPSGEDLDTERARELASRFWNPPSLEEQIRMSGVKPFRSIDDFPACWPPDEDIDEFLRFLREVRQ
jgi:hypothetical protein